MEVGTARRILAAANRFSVATDKARTNLNINDEYAVELAEEIVNSIGDMDSAISELEEDQVA